MLYNVVVACLLWALATPALCGQAVAQAAASPSAPSSEPASYKSAVNSALEEFDQGNFEEAREHFGRAHSIFPNARTLRGLGMTEFELRNYVDSVEKLEQALGSEVKRLDSALRKETTALLARAKAYVGEVYLHLTPASSEVHVDGFHADLSNDRRLRLAVGDHVLEFTAEGRLSERRALKMRGEQVIALSVVLAPAQPTVVAAAAGSSRVRREDGSAAHSPPLYKRWWLWTGVGVLVAGGITAGVLLSMRRTSIDDPNGGSTGDTLFAE